MQFKEIDPEFKKFPYIKTKVQIKAIHQAETSQSIVIYSFVSQEMRLWLRKEQRKVNIVAINLGVLCWNVSERLSTRFPDSTRACSGG